MTYELINPSDEIHFTTDGSREAETALCYIVLVLSSWKYGLKREDGETPLHPNLFATSVDVTKYWATRSDVTFDDWPMQNIRLIADVAASAKYARDRTSLSRIVDCFHDNAKRLRAQADRLEAELTRAEVEAK